MLLCWGPYGVLAFYAAVENANLVSPKLRMVMDTKSFHFSNIMPENSQKRKSKGPYIWMTISASVKPSGCVQLNLCITKKKKKNEAPRPAADCLSLPPLQMAPILAKTSPTFNVFLYALGNENYRGGIWQFLTGEKIEAPQIENKSK